MNRFTLSLCIGMFLAISALLLLVLHQQYQQNLTHTVAQSESLVAERPQLQFSLYNQNQSALDNYAQKLAELPAVTDTALYDLKGKMRASAGPNGKSLPPLKSLRADITPTGHGLVALENGSARETNGFWLSFTTGQALHLTLPVITKTQSTRLDLTAEDFISADLAPTNKSRKVMGYAQLRINTRALLLRGKEAALHALSLFLLAALICGAPIHFLVRKTSGPMADLNRVASQISSGKPIGELEVPKNKDFGRVANALNVIIRKVQMHEQEAEADRKILNRKVDESASKLSQQDDQLTRATQEIIQAKHELRKVAYYDSLTSLPNRALFQEQLQQVLKSNESNHQPLALLFVNLNNFSRVNDTFGYSVGDLVLTEIGQRLTQTVRQNNGNSPEVESGLRADVSRIGGDEFALILDQIDRPASAAKVAQRVIDNVTAPIQVLGQEIVVAPSIGIAVAPQDATDGESLSRAASAAMNSVEHSPKGAYRFYSDELVRDDLDHFKLESQLRKAIEKNELRLLYQPQIDTADGSIVCAEAFLRWVHPEQGEIPPAQFLPLARKIGILGELGRWTLLHACGQLKKLRASGLELPRIAINIAPDELGSQLVVYVCEALEASGISPDSLELGLSEIVLMDENSEERRCLREISELGVHISLDNFGISSTPLNHLSLCPLNEMKIDREIVRGCDSNKRNASLVRAVISIAKSLDLRIVAEGVETEAEFNFLVAAGARMLQGFLFSQPVSGDALQAQLKEPWPYMPQLQNFKLAPSKQTL